jgi:hypothetical protein
MGRHQQVREKYNIYIYNYSECTGTLRTTDSSDGAVLVESDTKHDCFLPPVPLTTV